MTKDHRDEENDAQPGEIGRRDFVALSVAGIAASASWAAAAAGLEVVETNVDIKTPDGTCDAAFFRPKTGSHPGVSDLAGRIRLATLYAGNSQTYCV